MLPPECSKSDWHRWQQPSKPGVPAECRTQPCVQATTAPLVGLKIPLNPHRKAHKSKPTKQSWMLKGPQKKVYSHPHSFGSGQDLVNNRLMLSLSALDESPSLTVPRSPCNLQFHQLPAPLSHLEREASYRLLLRCLTLYCILHRLSMQHQERIVHFMPTATTIPTAVTT